MLKRSTGSAASVVKAVLRGVLVSTSWAVIMAAILAVLLSREVIRMESVGYWAMGIHVTGAMLGAIASVGRIPDRKGVVMGLSAAGYFGVLLAVNWLCFGGQGRGLGTTMLLVLLGTAAAFLAGGKVKAGGRRKRYKIPS